MKAFPRADMKFNSLVSDELGMDLRDYFAAKAMQGLLASSQDLSWRELCGLSYDAADAMMKARTE